MSVHPTAIISDSASIGEGTTIGPYAVIGPKVIIGKNNSIGSHAVIEGNTRIGEGNRIFQFASIGAIPQDLKYKGEESVLEIGNKNIIREFTTLQPGTAGGGMITRVGDGNLFMANTHLGHDGIVGNSNIFANSVALAGHVTVGNRVIVGGLCGIHQFVRLGDFSILGAGSMVTQDIPPFCMGEGNRAGLVGLNVVGLERGGFSGDEIVTFKKFYRKLFLEHGNFKSKLEALLPEFGGFRMVELFAEFCQGSTRGIASSRKHQKLEDEHV